MSRGSPTTMNQGSRWAAGLLNEPRAGSLMIYFDTYLIVPLQLALDKLRKDEAFVGVAAEALGVPAPVSKK
jgi:hypothetical protein